MTYRITAETSPFVAEREPMFNGNTEVVLAHHLTLEEAHTRILNMYNEYYAGERPYEATWEMAVAHSAGKANCAIPTFSDGTRSFRCSGCKFSIEEETEY